MRNSEYRVNPAVEHLKPAPRPAAGLIATRLAEKLRTSSRSCGYVTLSEGGAVRLAAAMRCLHRDVDIVVMPPWDCLPYDRIAPSRQAMGQRMDALRVWSEPSTKPRLLITSLDAMLQRMPAIEVIRETWFELAVGASFDKKAFQQFVARTGYIEDSIVDEPGELAFRDDVIDVFPAGASRPMRIVVGEDGKVDELRSYDPVTQRTTTTLERMVFGPASEAIIARDAELVSPLPNVSESSLFQVNGDMQTVFNILDDVELSFEAGADTRVRTYLEIIDEAREARQRFDGRDRKDARSLYLSLTEWTAATKKQPRFDLDLSTGTALPRFVDLANPRKAFVEYVTAEHEAGKRIILVGEGRALDGLVGRVERAIRATVAPIDGLGGVEATKPGSLSKLSGSLDVGFVDGETTVIAVSDVVGEAGEAPGVVPALVEPELRLGDVVVHEDHGIGILKGLETVKVEGVHCDAARLEYQDGASLLVPMEDFGKLWRYGSEPEAVTLDRLHTENWSKRRATIDKDIRSAARHLLRVSKERKNGEATVFEPPQGRYADFARRFPYTETAHQTAAIDAVLHDLASGTVMNRLICGDVGFGKTEVALRACAAVALSGGQVAIIAPTTVLARQHFTNFERRFAGMGVPVEMLSRVVAAGKSNEVKAGLASGEVGIVVATHAILAKDISFSNLGLLIVDEEHRFGTREKQMMRNLAPHLHLLTMSATPIPRTLQSALIGVQDVSVLAAAPSKRRPVRTSVAGIDRAAIQIALTREHRRGGQSFVVVPQVADIASVETMLHDLVPDLSIRVAHGKMKGDAVDEIMVGFAEGDGDILLSTNIIESGLDVPRANTIFILRADRFGLAQLHQLRGRVGRGKRQGMAYLLTADDAAVSEETRLRLATMVENDRLGAGLAISLHDLDLRGAGDITGEDQAGHMKLIGVSLYQKLLERALASLQKQAVYGREPTLINIGIVGTIPEDYIPEAAVRLNLYARLLRVAEKREIDRLAEEFADRFGEVPENVSLLFRLTKLRIAATQSGLSEISGGATALAVTFATKPTQKALKAFARNYRIEVRDDRVIFVHPTTNAEERLAFLERLFDR